MAGGQCPHCGKDGHPPHVLKCPDTDFVLPLEGRVLDGKFKLIRQIGKGGMASVWLAVNTLVDRHVAIKLIRTEVVRREDTVKRFRAEARAAGRIGHPNICDILDFGSSPIGPYMVMEYLRGRSLAQRIRDDGPLPSGQAVAIARQALAGLAAAHREGIIHRDLKPENLFIHEPDDGEPVVKLMDFGVSKFTDGSGEVQTADGALLGTPEYMSPEQFRGAALADQRTDVWAMGAILYRALTGENAFSGPTIAATLLMVSTEPHRPIHAVRNDVPAGLVGIIDRCLEKTPDLRYPGARALSAALQPFETDAIPASGEQAPPSASASLERTITRARTTNKWTAQERRPSRLDRRALAIIVAILAAGAAGSWYALRAPTERPGTRDDLHARGEGSAAADPSEVTDDTPAAHDTGTRVATSEPSAAKATGHATGHGIDSEGASATGPLAEQATTGDAHATDAPAVATTATQPAATDGDEPVPTATSGADAPGDVGDDAGGDGGSDRPRHGDGADEPADPQAADDPEVPPEDPAGVIRFGPLVTPKSPGPMGTHGDARKHCERLASVRHLGIASWKLATPSTAAKLAGNKAMKRTSYWTSARWKGRVLVVRLPSGSKSSVKAERSAARPLCVAKWP
jgi:eukaryotic-like serine/threonine-protein kinase